MTKVVVYALIGVALIALGLIYRSSRLVMGGCTFMIIMELRLTERDIIEHIKALK